MRGLAKMARGPLPRGRLAALVSGCGLFVLAASFPFQTYVMPNLDDVELSLASRLRSPKFGDSYGYAKYAEGILEHGNLSQVDGTPILKHVPALPLLIATSVEAFASVRPLMFFQVAFLFVSLYFFLAKVRDRFPPAAIVSTAVLIALHPSTIKHSAGVMSDLLFGAMLLWVAFVLWSRELAVKHFVAVGVLLGVSVYVRESALPLMIVTGLAYLVKDAKRYFRPVLWMTLAFGLLLSPWTIRNYYRSGAFTLLTTKSADLFYHYSIPLTTEQYSPFGSGFQEGGYDYEHLYEVYDRAAREWGGSMSPAHGETPAERRERLYARYNPWADRPLPTDPIRVGAGNYLSAPEEQASSMFLKTIAFVNKPAILAHLAETSWAGLLVTANVIFFAVHLGTVVLGILLSFWPRQNVFPFLPYWIAAQYLQALLFWSEERYLMPYYPFLFLVAFSWYWMRWTESRAGAGAHPELI